MATSVDENGTVTYATDAAELPEGTLVELFFGAVKEYGGRPAQMFNDDGTWRSITYDEVYARVRHIAAALSSLGVERGQHVGLLSENRPEWAHADYALLCLGAWTVPIYPTLPSNQLAFIVRHAATRIMFVSTAEQLAKLVEAQAELPDLKTIITFDDTGSTAANVMTLAQLLARVPIDEIDDAAFREEALRARPGDVATMIYTSGTTGEPKGVMLSHNNLHSNVKASLERTLDATTNDIALSFLPLSHVFQRMVDYSLFSAGTTLAYVASIDGVLPAMRAVRPTLAVAVPRVYEKIYAAMLSATGVKRQLVFWARAVSVSYANALLSKKPPSAWLKAQHALADKLVYSKLRAKLGGRMRFFVSGGAPLAPDIARFFYGAGITILEGYGLTETSPVTNANTAEELRIGTVGRPVPGTEIRIAEDGEILVRGPQVMLGYYENAEATREVIDDEGWFHTGDIGALDRDGFLRITDRKKDLLVTAGGKNIAPQPIQNAVKASKFVAEAVLIGDRRAYPIVLVVPNFETLEVWAKEHGIDVADREKLVAEPVVHGKYVDEVASRTASFARYEKPKKVIVLSREFSLDRGEITPKLSIRRRVVEEHNKEAIEALYAEPAPPDHG